MSFSLRDIPNLAATVAIVTGGNAGIGEVCTRELARRNCKVYVLTRSSTRYNEFHQRVGQGSKSGVGLTEAMKENISFIPCDLSDLDSVVEAARVFKSREASLDILINNAGIMAVPFSLTKQGLEIQNGTNVVGHALLTYLLLDTLAHDTFGGGPPEYSWENLNRVNEDMGSTWKRYGKSKVGNILLSNEIKKLVAGERIVNISVNPGNVKTGLYAGLGQSYGFVGRLAARLISLGLITPEKGALSSLYAATSADVDSLKLNGAFLAPLAKVGKAAPWANDSDGSYGATMIQFIRTFVQNKTGLDIDELVERALRR